MEGYIVNVVSCGSCIMVFVVGGSDGPIHFPECLDLLLSLFSI